MLDRFVVTGSGRCGTKYLSRLLTAAGVPCGHEVAFNADGANLWVQDQDADSSWMAATMLDQVDVPVVLLVRNPLHVVRSWVEIGFFSHHHWDNPTHRPLERFAPQVYDWSNWHDRALAMWLALNRAALARAEVVVRLEQLDACQLGRLLCWAGADPAPAEQAFAAVPRCNRYRTMRERTKIQYQPGWGKHANTMAGDAIALAESLGYNTWSDPYG